MGLDITAHGKLEPLSDEVQKKIEAYRNGGKWDGPSAPEYDDALYINQKQHWPERLEGITPGFYWRNRTHGFRAGSYSGYNRWREQLCFMALRSTPTKLWDHEEEWKGKPFVELICFSDAEGTIGPVVSAKLHKDFIEHHDRAQEFAAKMEAREGAYFMEKYSEWTRAFEVATDHGCVDFH